MADNAPLPLATGSTRNAATDQVTYSGDVADVQLVRLVDVTGAEGSKTVVSPAFAVTGTFFQATQPVSFTWAGLTDTQLRASAVPVSLASTTVTGSVAVTGAFFQATQPVSAANLPLPAGAATETTIAALNTKVTAVNTGAVVLAAGSAIAGKFGIDQATPGTTNGVQITALSYPQSSGNNSSVQLAAGATFTGTIETVLSLQAAQIEVVCDQPYTVFIDQFIDAAGLKLSSTYTFTRLAGVPTNENVTLPGNYMRVRVTNTGSSATTTFQLDTTFGIMNTQPNTLSQFGNFRVVAQENGVVSTLNSTAVNLAASAVFTGAAEDVTEFSTLFVSVFASHASATDGLSVQFSADGTNWDYTDVFTIPATSGKVFSFGVQAKFFRLVYTNGATLTTSLRIQSLLSRTIKKSSSQRPSDGRGNDNDFEEIIAYLAGYNGATWDRLRSTVANGLQVDATRLPALATGANHIGAVSAQVIPSAALRERLSDTAGAAVASTVFGATASQRNCITTIALYNDSATNGFVDLRDGTAGAILMTLPLPAKGGSVVNLPVPLTTSVNTALAFDVNAALTTVYLSFVGFKSAL